MKAFILSIGNEIISGKILDTNSKFLALSLNKIGIQVIQILSISDDENSINQALHLALRSSADFIFTSGGLGPTRDDITKQCIVHFLEDDLVYHEESYQNILQLLHSKGREMNELNKLQAFVPSRSEVIINRYGTAPVLWSKKENKIVINLPGVPYEFQALTTEFILPKIQARFKLPIIIHQSVLVTGIGESSLAIQLKTWESELSKSLSLAYLPSASGVELRLSAVGNIKDEIQREISTEITKLEALLGDSIIKLSEGGGVEDELAKLMMEKDVRIAVAESGTEGRISCLINSLSGSSNYFMGSIVSHSKEIITKILKVKESSLEKHAMVSAEITEEMVRGITNEMNTTISLAITGITETNHALMGLTYISLFYKGKVETQKYLFPKFSKEELIERMSKKTLEVLYKHLLNN